MDNINQKALQMTRDYYNIPIDTDEMLLKTITYQLFCVKVAMDDLKHDFIDALPKWIKWIIGMG